MILATHAAEFQSDIEHQMFKTKQHKCNWLWEGYTRIRLVTVISHKQGTDSLFLNMFFPLSRLGCDAS